MKIIENGKIEDIRSTEIKGITPEMMRWSIENRTLEMYKMWHPDHIDYRVLRRPANGRVGYTYQVKEKFGSYTLSMKSTVLGWTDTTSTVVHRTYLYNLPVPLYRRRVHLEFERTPDGMIIHTTTIIGSDIPILGRFWNFITRKYFHNDKLRAAHAQHAKEENENFLNFLPKLYAERANKGPSTYKEDGQ